MKFQAPKFGKQKELDTAEYLLMINEYMDSIITRLQNMAPTANGWNIKTKRYSDGVRLKARFQKEKETTIFVPDIADTATKKKVDKIYELVLERMFGDIWPAEKKQESILDQMFGDKWPTEKKPESTETESGHTVEEKQTDESDDSEVSITQF